MIHVGVDASAWENERGFGRFARNLIAALAARDSGFRYTLLFDQAPTRPVPENVDVVIAGADKTMAEAASGKSARGGADLLTMSRAAARLKADVFFHPAVYSYFPKLGRKPSVVCYCDTIPERFPDLVFPSKLNFRLWQAKCWLAKVQATRVMTISQASADDLTAILKIAPEKIDLTTLGADDTFAPIDDADRLAARRAAYGIPADVPLLIYVGGFNRHKNVLRLIEAMPKILEQVPDTHLAIVGRTSGARFWDNVDELQNQAASDARASGRIVFTGEIDDSELAELLNAANALVFPTLWEGFGLPALEAMSCGTPVIASDRGSLPEVIGEGGLYFDPLDTDALAALTIKFLTDPALQAAERERALFQAKKFSWDKGAALAEASFHNALKRGSTNT